MKNFYLLLLIFFRICQTQEIGDDLAIVRDPEGYANVRATANANSKLVGKIKDQEIIYCSRQSIKNGWYPVNYENPADKMGYGTEIVGYVHQSRLTILSDLKQLNHVDTLRSSDSINIQGENVSIKIKSKRFNPNAHVIISGSDAPTLIDGKKAWGTDGGIPINEIAKIEVDFKGSNIPIPSLEYCNLYEPDFHRVNVYLDHKDRMYLHMMNSDGAGVYDVVFIFAKGKYIRKVVRLNPYV